MKKQNPTENRMLHAAAQAEEMSIVTMKAIDLIEEEARRLMNVNGNTFEAAAISGNIAAAAGMIFAISVYFSRMSKEPNSEIISSIFQAGGIAGCARLGITDVPHTFHAAPDDVQ